MWYAAPPKPWVGSGASIGGTTYWHGATKIGGSGTATAQSAGTLYYIPFHYPGLVINRIGIHVTAGSGNAHLGMYTNNNGVPGTLLVDGGVTDVSGTGIIGATVASMTLPDWCWGCVVFSGTPTVNTGVNAYGALIGSDALTNTRRGYTAAFAYGALNAAAPAPTGYVSSTAGIDIIVWNV
jgi:hypothetical protein